MRKWNRNRKTSQVGIKNTKQNPKRAIFKTFLYLPLIIYYYLWFLIAGTKYFTIIMGFKGSIKKIEVWKCDFFDLRRICKVLGLM